MQRFGMPLVPSALALWTINFVDRVFVSWYKGTAEVGVYSAAVKIAGVITFVMVAFRTAWPAFAYSIDDDRDAKLTYSFVLTYLLTFASWLALTLGALAPWWVALLTNPRFQRAQEGVPILAFAGAVYAGYTVLAIGSGRARRTQFNWVVTGTGAAVNIALNFWLIPAYGMVGAAISTLAAYVTLFLGMTLYAQHVYRVDYQWRRVITCVGVAVALTIAARAADLPFVPSLLLVLVYPLVLAALGFYLPAERRRFRRLTVRPSAR
jgi:O-antigen/teichoic acid export membrane protein